MIKQINLRIINESDYQFLYDLLSMRNPKANISHKKMPTYLQHVKFIKSKPYSKWYVILNDKERIGSIYLSKNNEIGVFLNKKIQSKGYGHQALKQIIERNPRKQYLANINPNNKKSIEFFMRNQFKLIQYTYELTNH